MVGSPPASAGDMGLSPGEEDPHAAEQLAPCDTAAESAL